jgi:hypothetical protein
MDRLDLTRSAVSTSMFHAQRRASVVTGRHNNCGASSSVSWLNPLLDLGTAHHTSARDMKYRVDLMPVSLQSADTRLPWGWL